VQVWRLASRQALVLASLRSSQARASRLASPTEFLRLALVQVSLKQSLVQALVHSSGRVSLVSVP
jgi:hypothetical protein